MNHIKYFLTLFLLVLVMSCETYEEPAIEYAPIYPIAGEYITWIYEADTLYKENMTVRFYNTSANENDSMWIKMSTKSQPYGILAKAGCNISNLTFAKENGSNVAFTPSRTFSVTDGKVLLNGASKKPSGTVPDSIHFVLTQNGRTFEVGGFRRTQWPQDELVW